MLASKLCNKNVYNRQTVLCRTLQNGEKSEPPLPLLIYILNIETIKSTYRSQTFVQENSVEHGYTEKEKIMPRKCANHVIKVYCIHNN
jgi:hypothetical protein